MFLESTNNLGPSSRSRKPKRRWYRRKRLWLFVALVVLCLIAWVARGPLLSAFGRWWIVDAEPVAADAIVVLGGGVETRPPKAAELYQAGLAPRLLVLSPQPLPSTRLGVTPQQDDVTRQILLKLGVPESAITFIGDEVSSTQEEAEAIRAWVAEHGAERLLVPTDPFHTRRVDWFLGRMLEDHDVEVHTIAVVPLNYRPDDWWQSEGGLVAFQNELIKTIYYWVKY